MISETLNACTPENVEQMQQAMKEIYQQHSAGSRHDYEQSLQLLDTDMTRATLWQESGLRDQRLLCQAAQSAWSSVGARTGHVV